MKRRRGAAAWPNSEVVEGQGKFPLDDTNCILLVQDFLGNDKLRAYREASWDVERYQGKTIFGHLQPRFEKCYTEDGKPYIYSGRSHPTEKYPKHVHGVVSDILDVLKEHDPKGCFRLSHGVDIEYNATLPRGGSIGEHSDDEENWAVVAIFSLGQSRTLRFRRKYKESGQPNRNVCHLSTGHNTLVIMYGDTFQQKYTHEVMKLKVGEPVSTRWSLNLRFHRDH